MHKVLDVLFLNIFHGIAFYYELLLRVFLKKKTFLAYAFKTKHVVILCLLGIMFFVYATNIM